MIIKCEININDEVSKIPKLFLISPIPPSVNHYLADRAIIRNGKPLPIRYKTQEATKYQQNFKKYVKQQVFEQKWTLVPNKTQHFYVDTVFYFDRKDRDCNNYFKCLLDTITETQLIWLDDNVTCERVQRIYYDNKNPRVEITIYPVEYIGIFDNQNVYDEFVGRCEQCKRHGKCSVLQSAIEGRVSDDIENNECKKFRPIKKEK